MAQETQAQAVGAPFQKLLTDTMSMAVEGLEVSQAQGKKFLESAFELGAANGKDGLKCADELCGRFTEATTTANELLKGQAALFNELLKDPMGATQKMVAGYVEGSRKGLEFGAEGLKSYVSFFNDAWARLEKASQEGRANYVAFIGKLQSIVETAGKKN